MKKSIGIIAVIYMVCTQAMEQMHSNTWSIIVDKTTINLNKGNVVDFYIDTKKNVDFIVADTYARPRKNDPHGFLRNSFVQKNKHKIVEIGMSQVGISSDFNVFYERYNPEYKIYQKKILSFEKNSCCYHSVDEVIEEALKDLRLCYKKALTNIGKLTKSIALPTLSIGSYKSCFQNNHDLEDKAALCILTIILGFIKDNLGLFDYVELFVEEDFDFNLYKELLSTFKIAPKTKTVYWEK